MAESEQDVDGFDDIDIDAAVVELDEAVPAVDPPDEDGYADIVGEDRPRGEDGKFIKKEAPPPDEPPAAAPEAPVEGASVVPPPAAVDPFAEWAPFPFKADGVETTIAGIRANDTHVVIPREVFEGEFRNKHLANRESWQQERQQWHGRIQQAEQSARAAAEQKSEREMRADAVLQEFQGLMQDPERLQAFLQDFERQAPILQADIRAKAAEERLQQRERAEQQQRQQVEYQTLEQRAADVFESAVVELLKDPKYAGLVTSEEERDDLCAELWDPRAVLIADRDYPEHGLRRGDIVPPREQLQQALDKRAAFLARRLSAVQRTTNVEQRNAAAVASPVTSPQTTKPATSAPPRRPASPTRAPSKPVGRVEKATVTQEDRDRWDADYARVFD